jgi:preprotein translocase subunit YajC
MEKSKKIIEKIKAENIKPIPKWHFKVKNYLKWGIFTLSIILGAGAFSVILFTIQQTDFNLVSYLSYRGLELFLALLPFFWIVILLIFLFLAIISIQKSNQGYRATWARLTRYSVAGSVLLGTLFFIGGGAKWLERSFAQHVDVYQSMEDKKKIIWMQPEAGYLAGTIDKVNGDTLYLIDFDQRKWQISYQNAFIAPVISVEKGESIKLVGEKINEAVFRADELRPWGGPQHHRRMKERKNKP